MDPLDPKKGEKGVRGRLIRAIVCWRSPCRSDEAEKRLRKAKPMKMADLAGRLCKRVWKSKWVMGGLSRIKWRRADGRKRADLGD